MSSGFSNPSSCATCGDLYGFGTGGLHPRHSKPGFYARGVSSSAHLRSHGDSAARSGPCGPRHATHHQVDNNAGRCAIHTKFTPARVHVS